MTVVFLVWQGPWGKVHAKGGGFLVAKFLCHSVESSRLWGGKTSFGHSNSVQSILEGTEVFQETGRILFREYCFGEENSLSLTEFYGKLGEFCEELGEFALAHK